LVVLRWAPTVPAFALGSIAILTLVGRARLRAGGLRPVVETVLFLTAGLVVVQLVFVGVDGSWRSMGLEQRIVLGAATLATSAMMAAALTALGVMEGKRQTMALVLLLGAVALTTGRAVATAAVLSGALGVFDISRFFIVGGLWLLAAAAVVDPGRSSEELDRRAAGRYTDLGQLLPHAAMAFATVVVGVVAMAGHRPSRVSFGGIVLCVAFATVHRWVSARDERRMATRLRRSEAYFRSLVRSSGDAVVILDDRLRVTWASAAFEQALGTVQAGLLGRPLLETVHPDDVAAVAAALGADDERPDEDSAPVNAVGNGLLLLRLRAADGAWHYLEAAVSDLREHADVGAVVLHCRDMTERHTRGQALRSVAYTDPMTGLPNQAGFQQLLQDAVSALEQPPSTLLMIELDGLAAARDRGGRDIVRTAVTEIGRRLRATVRGEDVVARIGEGIFAVLATGDAADVDRLAARCHAVVEQPVSSQAGIVDLTAGVGLVDVEPGLTVDALLGRADLAVRQAHAAGPGSSYRYLSTLGEVAVRQERLRAELVGACSRGELSLLFQPVLFLEEQKITGVEALVRWRHPTLGEVPPSEFIPIAESSGLIGYLLRWILETAATAVASLPDTAGPLQLGVNVPAGYVATGMLVSDVQHALRESGLPPERLILEINEATVLSDDERVALDLSTLRLMGVHVALDGFGTGRSALGHLTQLPIDVLKLDRSLISRINRDPQSRALCESIVGIGRALNLDVVAEGVESTGQLATLSGFGCGFAQGFLISRPMPISALVSALGVGAEHWWPGVMSTA
jgi:diguanylate cyclase (GGDEF)-like protein/PAS domain S-box-containing protein